MSSEHVLLPIVDPAAPAGRAIISAAATRLFPQYVNKPGAWGVLT